MIAKDSIELIIAIVAVIIGGAGLTVGTVALAFIVGIKNSTHQVAWKDVTPPAKEEVEEDENDPFIYSEAENPNKKIKTEKDEDDFADLSDPSITSNDWR